jgi:hypothetical protein
VYGEEAAGVTIPAVLNFGSWIGGDRDGNPFVLPATTEAAALLQSRLVLAEYISRLEDAASRLTHSSQLHEVDPAFLQYWEEQVRELSSNGDITQLTRPPPLRDSNDCHTATNKLRIVTVGGRSRGRYATPAGFPLHDGTPYWWLRVRRWGLEFFHRSRTIFCRAVPNLRVTIRNFRIACTRRPAPPAAVHPIPRNSRCARTPHAHGDTPTSLIPNSKW